MAAGRSAVTVLRFANPRLLFRALFAGGPINLRKVDGWPAEVGPKIWQQAD